MWRKPYRPDPDALAKVLQEQAAEAADVPFRIQFGWGQPLGLLVGLIALLAVPVLFWILAGFELPFAFAFLGAFLLLALGTNVQDFTTLNVAVIVSEDGVQLEKLHRRYLIPWWQVYRVRATRDLTWMQAVGRQSRITIDLRRVATDKRNEIAHVIIAHGRGHSLGVEEWPRGDRFRRDISSAGLAFAGVVVMVGAFYFFLPQGHAIGVRCGVNSAFLQRTFGTPDRQGCVALRISAGAEAAGMLVGDLIIEVNGIPITSGVQFTQVFKQEKDDPFTFKVIRRGYAAPIDLTVRFGGREQFQEDPSDPFFYYLRARARADEEPSQAVADYDRAIQLEPDFDLAYLYRAQLYGEMGEHDRATEDFLRAMELTPNLGEAHRLFGYHDRRRGVAAVQFRARKAIELDACEGSFERYNVDCAEDYFLLATTQVNFHDLGEPIATAQQAIRFWPGAVQAYYLLATLYERAGDIETAGDYARQYLEFPEEERFPESEANAKRIRDLAQ